MTFSYIKRQDPRDSIFPADLCTYGMVVYHLTKSDQIRQLTSEFWRAIKTHQISKRNTGSNTDFKTRSQGPNWVLLGFRGSYPFPPVPGHFIPIPTLFPHKLTVL